MSGLQEKGAKQGMTESTAKLKLKNSETVRYNLSVQQQKELTALYKKLSKKVKEEAEKLDPDKNVSSAMKQNVLHKLQLQIEDELRIISEDTKGIITNNLSKVSKSVVLDNTSFLTSVGMKGIEEAYSNVPTDVVASIISGDLYEGKWTLSTALWSDVKSKTKDINSIITEGVALNKPSYEIAKDLEQYVNPTAKKPWDWGKVYPGVSKKVDYNAQRLARTLVSHAYQQSLMTVTKPNPFVTGLEWRSANTDRTCEICAARDGKVYPKDGLPLDHPNGMCTFIAVIPDSMESIANRIADWYDGKADSELDEFAKVLGYKEPEIKTTEEIVKEYKLYTSNSQEISDQIFEKMYGSINNISEEQLKAIKDYCGDSYKAMNTSLRGKMNKGGSKLTPSQIKSEIKILQNMFDNSKSPEDLTVFRGVTRNAIGAFEKGKIISDKAFLSTSLSQDIALGFTKYSKNGVLVRIEVDSGTSIIPATSVNKIGRGVSWLDEAEILLNSNQKLEMKEERIVTLDHDVKGDYGNILFPKGSKYTEIVLRVVN